ncbi:hypothetical protein QE152_g13717 [Popillia japonica]|uniref:PHD-type domain-containing protein n=1 Tax=Popillia japonica TaxID=7064 RepID=A0AAW1L924_POPJA
MPFDCSTCCKVINRYHDYITSSGGCKCNFHIECVELSIEDVNVMKEENRFKKWMCTVCTTLNKERPTPSPQEVLAKQLRDEIIKQINETGILPLKEEIKELSKQNGLQANEIINLKALLQKGMSDKNQRINTSENTAFITQKPRKGKNIQSSTLQKPEVIDLQKEEIILNKNKETYAAKTKGGARNENSELENLRMKDAEAETMKSNDDEFMLVARKRMRRNFTVFGTGNDCLIKGVTPYKHYHVCGLGPDTTSDEIMAHLSQKNFTKINCEKMNAKRPTDYSSFKISVPLKNFTKINCEKMNAKRPTDYSSFKISVPLDQSTDFINPLIWPTGVKINKYYFHRFQKKEVQK